MKIQQLLEAKKAKKKVLPKAAAKKAFKKAPKKVAKPVDDFEDDEGPVEDPESDKVPHLVMQLRKALDVDGNYPVVFKDGKKKKLSMDEIRAFLIKYISAKPLDREAMQNAAAGSYEDFLKASSMKVAVAPKSIYTR